jgi:glycosyltransferase involved in cell wall biosynthesis
MEWKLTKKKVIITMDWFDPAYKAGGPVMSIVKLIENLHEYYDFYVLAGSKDYGDDAEMPNLLQDEWIDWRGMAKVYYLSEQAKSRRRIFFILDEIDADIYYIQGVFSLYFSIYPLIWWHQAKEDKVIVATRGMFHASALKVKRFKKLCFLYAAKIMGWYHHVYFHSTNPDETKQLRKILGNEATYIEASNFPRSMEFNNDLMKSKGELKLLNVARISPEKNTHFLLEILKDAKGNIELTIVGNYADESYYNLCVKRASEMPSNIKVNFAGHQPIGALQGFYDTHHVFILPTTGENFGHSIIEALSSGLPCIISNKTPWNQLEDSGAGYNLENETGNYLPAIQHFLELDQNEFNVARKSALEYSQKRVNLEEIRNSYFKLLS